MKGDASKRNFATRAIHAGQDPEPVTGAVAVPIFQTSTYVQPGVGREVEFEYARVQNPTRTALEENVASLEGGRSGHAFASGMAAISALLTLVRSGEHVVVSRNVYGGTYRYFTQILERHGLSFSWVDSRSPKAIEDAMTKATRLVFVETPTNPLMEITDLTAAAEIAHRHDALLAVDNTFLSPYLQRPIEQGADVVMHSTTKFLNGHSDSIGGALIAASQEQGDWFAFVQKSAGAVLAPLDCFLILRGIKTLDVRMERHEKNGRAVAARLAKHAKVDRVLYPGLADHPGREIHERQASGYGAMITADLGSFDKARDFLEALEVFSLAESLGGVESLASHPSSMTHASVPPEQRRRIGLEDGMIRLSVGLEDLDDLLGDLEQALA